MGDIYFIEGYCNDELSIRLRLDSTYTIHLFLNTQYKNTQFINQVFQNFIDTMDAKESIYTIFVKWNTIEDIKQFSKLGFKQNGNQTMYRQSISIGERIKRNIDNQSVLDSLQLNQESLFYIYLMKLAKSSDEIQRIKLKLNRVNHDLFYESSAKKTRVFLLNHLGLGDHIGSIGMARHLSTLYDTVIIGCLRKNLANLQQFYKDDPCIEFYPVEKLSDISMYYGMAKSAYETMVKDYDRVVATGFHSGGIDTSNFPLCFYSKAGFEESIYWSHFFIPESSESKTKYMELCTDLKNLGIETYGVITTNTSDGPTGHPSTVCQKLSIDSSKILVLTLDGVNAYPETHPFFAVTQKYSKLKLFEMVDILKHAQFLVLADSSVFCLALQLGIKISEFYYIYRCWDYNSKLLNPHIYKKGKIPKRLDI